MSAIAATRLPPADEPPLPDVYDPTLPRTVKLFLLATVALVTGMEFLTSYAVGVALPDMQGDLAASLDEGSWIITTYTTTFLIGLVLSGRLADYVGYRRYMIVAVALYTASAIGCAQSHTLMEALWFRGLMGFAGGAFLTRAQTAINLAFTGAARIRALVVFALFVVGVCRTVAPAVGGYLAEWHSWRWIFLLNVPLAAAALVMLIGFLPDVRARRPGATLDIVGAALLIAWVAALQILLSRGQRDDWFADPFIRVLAVIAAACLPLFIWWECRGQNRHPIINLAVYRERNFVVGSVYVVILGMMLYGQMYFVPQILRGVLGHSSWSVGRLQTLNAGLFFVGLLIGAILMTRVGLKPALGIGAGAFAAGMWFWATRLTPAMPEDQMYLPLALTGFGAGWQIGPLSTLINSRTPPLLMGDGMELYLCQRQLGGSWGIAILTILFDRQRSFWSSRLGEQLTQVNPFAQDALHQGAGSLGAAGLPQAAAEAGAAGFVHGRLVLQSTVNAFVDTYWYQVALSLFAICLVLLFTHAGALRRLTRWTINAVR
jgi:DHA2 family multidrug resistance protein